MSLIVQKFGGSSVANAERVMNVARIITDTYAQGNNVIVVVSAQGDTTDDLIAKAEEINPKASKREMDMLLSSGEQISIALLAIAIEKLGFPVKSLTGWQAGFQTDSTYSNSRIRRINHERLEHELGKGNICIVAGFQGMLGLHHTWNQGNVMFTLLLGFLAVTGIRINRCGSRWWAPLAVLVCTSFVTVDYGMNGVLLAILLYLCRERRGAIAAVMAAFCMYWGATSPVVNGIFGYRWNSGDSLVGAVMNLAPIKPFLRLQALAVLAMPLMVIRRKKRTPLPRAVAYAAYPGHLLILWLVQLLMEKTTLATAQKLLIPWL